MKVVRRPGCTSKIQDHIFDDRSLDYVFAVAILWPIYVYAIYGNNSKIIPLFSTEPKIQRKPPKFFRKIHNLLLEKLLLK